jgi:hypothetical protein
MKNKTANPTVFLSHPVTEYMQEEGGYKPEKELFAQNVVSTLESKNLVVKCAAVNEDYGRIKLKPIDFTQYDVQSIEKSDIFVLIASDRISRDMYLEVGIAFSLKIPILFFISHETYRRSMSFMLLAFEEMKHIKVFCYNSESEISYLIDQALN